MSKFEFIPEASIVRNTDPSPGQKFMDPFDAVFEAIQNSGDNPLNQKNCVKVHINHEKVYKNDLKFLDSNFEKHIKNSKKVQKKSIETSDVVDLFIIEDFNTTGITGDPDKSDDQTETGKVNNFYFMNHSFGENQKLDDAKAGGSEGEGVQAFNLNSDISTFFYYTVDSSNNNRPAFFGISYLGTRHIDQVSYLPHAFFGKKVKNEKFKEDYYNGYPVTDKEEISNLVKLFKLKRKPNESGTSIIIPYYVKNGLDNKELLTSKIIEIYRVPILKGQLEICVGKTIINKDTIKNLNKDGINPETESKFNQQQKDLLDSYYAFLGESEKIKDDSTKFIEITNNGERKLEKNIFSNFEDLLKQYHQNELIGIKINFNINKIENKKSLKTSAKFFLQKYPNWAQISEKFNDYMRGKMSIHKVRHFKQFFTLMDFQEDEAALLLKNAEVANHSNIDARNPKLKTKYKSYFSLVTFLKKFPIDLFKMLSNEEGVIDHDITQDLFKREGSDTKIRATDDLEDDKKYEDEEDEGKEEEISIFKVPDIIVPPIFPRLLYYERWHAIKDDKVSYNIKGVKYNEGDIKDKILKVEKYLKETDAVVRKNYSIKELNRMDTIVRKLKNRLLEYKDFLANNCTFYPRRIEIEAAFDGEGMGNRSFRRYCTEDFDFSDDDKFSLKLEKNVKLDNKNENHITLIAKNEEFKFNLLGFDKKNIEDVRWRDRSYSTDN